MTEPSQYFKGRTVQEQMNEVIGYVDTRAAEVATTAIASDVAQVHQDMLDADADAQAAAASAAAAAGTLANAVKKTGEASQSIARDIAVAGNLSGGVVTGTTITAPTPVNNTDAANKKYVDDADALKADKTYVDAKDALAVPINNVNAYAVGLAGNQNPINGQKTFTGNITHKNGSTPGASSPQSYVSTRDSFSITGTDDVTIIGIGFEKSTTDTSRLVLRVNANLNTNTNKTPAGELHFILNENIGTLVLQPAHIDKDGVRTFGTAQTLMTWTP